jgi:hypothetical protein
VGGETVCTPDEANENDTINKIDTVSHGLFPLQAQELAEGLSFSSCQIIKFIVNYNKVLFN